MKRTFYNLKRKRTLVKGNFVLQKMVTEDHAASMPARPVNSTGVQTAQEKGAGDVSRSLGFGRACIFVPIYFAGVELIARFCFALPALATTPARGGTARISQPGVPKIPATMKESPRYGNRMPVGFQLTNGGFADLHSDDLNPLWFTGMGNREMAFFLSPKRNPLMCPK